MNTKGAEKSDIQEGTQIDPGPGQSVWGEIVLRKLR